MRVGELKKILEGIENNLDVFIPLHKEGVIVGGKPRVEVIDANWDFDWNRGFWIIPKHQLKKVIR